MADLDLFTQDQQDAWSRGDYWAAIGGVFVHDERGLRFISLAEAGRWAA